MGGVKTAAWRAFRRRSALHRAAKSKRVTAQGPVKKPPMDYMPHRGGGEEEIVQCLSFSVLMVPPAADRRTPTVNRNVRLASEIKLAHQSRDYLQLAKLSEEVGVACARRVSVSPAAALAPSPGVICAAAESRHASCW